MTSQRKVLFWAVLIFAFGAASCAPRRNNVDLVVKGPIQNGFYVIALGRPDGSECLYKNGRLVIDFDEQRIAKLKSGTCVDGWGEWRMVSTESPEILAPPWSPSDADQTRYLWDWRTSENVLWVFVGTKTDREKMGKKYTAGEFTIEFP